MLFNFAFGQYDRCNTGETASVEGCDFSNGKNREALNWFFAAGDERNARNANFSGINFLADTDITEFSGRDFTGSDFSGSVLPYIGSNNNFTDADFSGAIHSGDDQGNIYSDASFDGATLENGFYDATLTNASFVSTIFDGVLFDNCYMDGSTFKDVRGYSLKFQQGSLERITIEDARLFEIDIMNSSAGEPTSMIDAKLINAHIVFPEYGIYDGIVSSDLVANGGLYLQEPWVIEDGVLLNFYSLNGTNSKDSADKYSDKSSKGHDYYSVDADRDGCISLIEFNRFYKKIK